VTSLLIVGAVITIGASVALGLARAHRLRRQSSKHSQSVDRRERSTAAQEARRSTELNKKGLQQLRVNPSRDRSLPKIGGCQGRPTNQRPPRERPFHQSKKWSR
jgi:hypothetical protein